MLKPWSPSKRDLRKAWTLHKKGKLHGGRQLDIQKALKISKSTYRVNASVFSKYFRLMAREASRNPSGSGPGRPKGDRKLSVDDLDLELLSGLVAVGYNYKDIAGVLHIDEDTLRRYRREFPEVRDALDNTISKQNTKIIGAMLSRALGHEDDATHFSAYEGRVTGTDYKKKYPPDVEAGRLLLANRIGFVKDVDPKRTDNKGSILSALETMMSEEDKE